MKKTFKFTIATQYVRSAYSEEIELEFDDDATESEIDSEVDTVYNEWLSEHNYGGIEAVD
jgi:hypothetical protein